MRIVVGAVLGAGAAVAAWTATRPLFAAPVFTRRNYRGAPVPVGAGVLLAVAALAVEAVFTTVDAAGGGGTSDRPGRLVALLVVLGFALLGVLDDLGAEGDDRGFRGHLRAMAAGRLTTGGLKLIGGGLLAVVVAGLGGSPGLGRLALDALVIALAANTANLFDRAPGRAIKVGLIAALPLLALAGAGDRRDLTGVAVVIGAAAGLLAFDLREQLMLGDAGSNAIGAVLALGFVRTTDVPAHWVALAVLGGLNVVSERVSFSTVIDSVAPLRALDRLGRRPSRSP